MASRRTMAVVATVIAMAFVTVLIVLSLTGGVDDYTPATDDGEVIYREACARCHGDDGAGVDPGGPRLAGQAEGPEEVREHVREGKGRMPRFPNIRGRALDNLAAYVNGL